MSNILTVGYWNIEKTGQSSELDKKAKVEHFIHECCGWKVDLIFLCEVHSARLNGMSSHLTRTYPEYFVDTLPGGYSNAYILMSRHDKSSHINVSKSQDLMYLNRAAFIVQIDKLRIVLAHFKSGRTGVTESQISSCAIFLEGMAPSNQLWAIMGDMNWNYLGARPHPLPNLVQSSSYWQDMTQRSGGILDWCMFGSSVRVEFCDLKKEFHLNPEMFDMRGPDHKPLIASFNW